jgi:hypothetical protein
LKLVRPELVEREEINRIIMRELVYGVFKADAVEYHRQVIGRMKEQRLRCSRPWLHQDSATEIHPAKNVDSGNSFAGHSNEDIESLLWQAVHGLATSFKDVKSVRLKLGAKTALGSEEGT